MALTPGNGRQPYAERLEEFVHRTAEGRFQGLRPYFAYQIGKDLVKNGSDISAEKLQSILAGMDESGRHNFLKNFAMLEYWWWFYYKLRLALPRADQAYSCVFFLRFREGLIQTTAYKKWRKKQDEKKSASAGTQTDPSKKPEIGPEASAAVPSYESIKQAADTSFSQAEQSRVLVTEASPARKWLAKRTGRGWAFLYAVGAGFLAAAPVLAQIMKHSAPTLSLLGGILIPIAFFSLLVYMNQVKNTRKNSRSLWLSGMALALGVVFVLTATLNLTSLVLPIGIATFIFAFVTGYYSNWLMARETSPKNVDDMWKNKRPLGGLLYYLNKDGSYAYHSKLKIAAIAIGGTLLSAGAGAVWGVLTVESVMGLPKLLATIPHLHALAATSVTTAFLGVGIVLGVVTFLAITFMMLESFSKILQEKNLTTQINSYFKKLFELGSQRNIPRLKAYIERYQALHPDETLTDEKIEALIQKFKKNLSIERVVSITLMVICTSVVIASIIGISLTGYKDAIKFIHQLPNLFWAIAMTLGTIGQIPFTIQTTVKAMTNLVDWACKKGLAIWDALHARLLKPVKASQSKTVGTHLTEKTIEPSYENVMMMSGSSNGFFVSFLFRPWIAFGSVLASFSSIFISDDDGETSKESAKSVALKALENEEGITKETALADAEYGVPEKTLDERILSQLESMKIEIHSEDTAEKTAAAHTPAQQGEDIFELLPRSVDQKIDCRFPLTEKKSVDTNLSSNTALFRHFRDHSPCLPKDEALLEKLEMTAAASA